MAKREFLQLAHTYNTKKHGIAGWFLSEKLDGMRALWDGGISRGVPCNEVPWANTEKHARFRVQPVATGLWTRYGQPIHAPDWFLDALPPAILDGELYAGRGMFQHVVSSVKKLVPQGDDWADIRYMVFDAPRADEVFADGIINNTNFKKTFKGIPEWAYLGSGVRWLEPTAGSGFHSRLKFLTAIEHRYVNGEVWAVHEQKQLPFNTPQAIKELDQWLDWVILAGGEGVILKSPSNLWVPERSHTMLKHKAVHDAEGTVIGYTWGRETDKGSKLLGLMGALILTQDNGQRLELSGFTDAERRMEFCKGVETAEEWGLDISEYGSRHPGEEVRDCAHNPSFPRGSRVTYKYRELTDDGIAKEARYWRKA